MCFTSTHTHTHARTHTNTHTQTHIHIHMSSLFIPLAFPCSQSTCVFSSHRERVHCPNILVHVNLPGVHVSWMRLTSFGRVHCTHFLTGQSIVGQWDVETNTEWTVPLVLIWLYQVSTGVRMPVLHCAGFSRLLPWVMQSVPATCSSAADLS